MKKISTKKVGMVVSGVLVVGVFILFQNCGSSTPATDGSASGGVGGASGGTTSGGGSGSSAITVSNAVTFSGANIDTPDAIAVDGNGDVWVANWNLSGVTRIHPSTATSNCSTGCTAYTHITAGTYGGLTSNLRSITVDASNNVWVPGGILMEITHTGVVQEVIALQNQSIGAYGAIDSSGNIWSSYVNATNAGGTRVANYPLSNKTTSFPFGIAIDSANNAWVTITNGVIKYPAGTTYTGGGLVSASDVAVDNLGNVWVVNDNSGMGTGSATVTEIQNGATSNCSSGCVNFTNAALATAEGVAIDGANNVWIAGGLANGTSSLIIKIAPGAASDCSTGCTYYTNSTLVHPTRLAIDSAGNVWIADEDESAIIEYPGLAASTTTPIVNQTR